MQGQHFFLPMPCFRIFFRDTAAGVMNLQQSEIIKLANINFIRQGKKILHDLSWSVCAGQHWVLIGPNGSGKTTLVQLMSLYEWPATGTVHVNGVQTGTVPIAELRRRIRQMQPSSFAPDQFFGMTAREVIATGLNNTLGPWNIPGTDPDFTEKLVSQMQIQPRFEKWLEQDFRTLSAGEKRKTLLLRAFAGSPELLIIDEPFDALDIPSYFSLSVFLSHVLTKEIRSSVTVLHRIDEIPRGITHTLLLKDGKVLKSGPVGDVIRSDTISELYGMTVEVKQQDGRFTTRLPWPKNV